jgi:hypothetical protein
MRANIAVEAAAPICTMKMEQRAKRTPLERLPVTIRAI